MKRDWLALSFAMIFPSVMAWLYFVQLAEGQQQANVLLQVVMSAGKMLQFGFPAVYIWFVHRQEIGWPKFQTRGLALGIGFGLLAALAMAVLYFGGLRAELSATGAPAKIRAKLIELGFATPLRYLAAAAFYSLCHSLLEEYYWRWFVFRRLHQLVPFSLAVLISSVAFMSHHVIILGVYFPHQFWTMAVPFSLCVAFGGAAWAWLYQQSQSIYAVWFSHLLVDAAIFFVGYDLVVSTSG